MELLTQFIAPIVSLWVIHNAIFSSARFVNEMRETVISDVYKDRPLARGHRKAIFVDWGLCIIATILVCFIFAGILIAVSTASPETNWIGIAIASYPLICGLGFIICSSLDLRLMWRTYHGAAAIEGEGARADATSSPRT